MAASLSIGHQNACGNWDNCQSFEWVWSNKYFVDDILKYSYFTAFGSKNSFSMDATDNKSGNGFETNGQAITWKK